MDSEISDLDFSSDDEQKVKEEKHYEDTVLMSPSFSQPSSQSSQQATVPATPLSLRPILTAVPENDLSWKPEFETPIATHSKPFIPLCNSQSSTCFTPLANVQDAPVNPLMQTTKSLSNDSVLVSRDGAKTPILSGVQRMEYAEKQTTSPVLGSNTGAKKKRKAKRQIISNFLSNSSMTSELTKLTDEIITSGQEQKSENLESSNVVFEVVEREPQSREEEAKKIESEESEVSIGNLFTSQNFFDVASYSQVDLCEKPNAESEPMSDVARKVEELRKSLKRTQRKVVTPLNRNVEPIDVDAYGRRLEDADRASFLVKSNKPKPKFDPELSHFVSFTQLCSNESKNREIDLEREKELLSGPLDDTAVDQETENYLLGINDDYFASQYIYTDKSSSSETAEIVEGEQKKQVECDNAVSAVINEMPLGGEVGAFKVPLDHDERKTPVEDEFCGFKTAAGRELGVSEEKLKIAETIYEKIDVTDVPGVKRPPNDDFCGFSTAGGKKIEVGAESVKRAERMIEEALRADANDENSVNDEDKPSNQGFSTMASGKKLFVDSSKLRVEEKFYTEMSNVDADNNRESKRKVVKQEDDPAERPSKRQRRGVLSSMENIEETANSDKANDKAEDAKDTLDVGDELHGFSQMEIAQSEAAYEKFVQINRGETRGFHEKSNDDVDHESQEPTSEMPDILFADDMDVDIDNLSPRVSPSDFKMQGFSTAGGKEIAVSEGAIQLAKTRFASDLEEEDSVAKDEEGTESMPGFSTAAGKAIQVSKTALEMAETLYTKELKTKMAPGFSTAGGKEIKVSSGAVEKAKDLFANDLESQEASPLFKGFSTAAGSNIQVSKGAIQRAQSRFVDDLKEANESFYEDVEERSTNVSNSNEFPGFSTAGGQSISISKAALEKAHSSAANDLEEEKTCGKRKSGDFNDNTPLGRASNLNNHKKACYDGSPEANVTLQARKLFTEEDTMSQEAKNDVSMSIEVAESANALLEDDLSHSPASPVLSASRSVQQVKERNKTGTKLSRKLARRELEDVKFVNLDDDIDVKESVAADDYFNETSGYGDTQVFREMVNEKESIREARLSAATKQDLVIREKRRCKILRVTGALYKHKEANKANRTSLREYGRPTAKLNSQESNMTEVFSVTAANALDYKFNCAKFYGDKTVDANIEGIEVADGARLIMDEYNQAGVAEFARAFLASSGVDPRLVPESWIDNHYRLIVWKLASYDRVTFENVAMQRCLTPDEVMRQLRYRYDREIDRAERPVLRKILEKDTPSTRRMVLCVSRIEKVSLSGNLEKSPRQSKYSMELTDGWYRVPATIDYPMASLIDTKKIYEGIKLVVYGAELLCCDHGVSPLQMPCNVSLKLHTNSVRRARWDAQLGYQKCPGPMVTKISSLYHNGGVVGKIAGVVARVYPLQYREKTADGQITVRNEKNEEKAKRAYEAEYEKKVEAFYARAQYEQQRYRRDDPSEDDVRNSQESLEKLESEMRSSLPPRRQVNVISEMRVVTSDGSSAVVSVWIGSEDSDVNFKEGQCLSICNLFSSRSRFRELQLTASKNAIFSRESFEALGYVPRTVTPINQVPDASPLYDEFDTVGIVSFIGPAPYGMKNHETVILASVNANNEPSFLSIIFSPSIEFHGYAKFFTIGSFVACSNLQMIKGPQSGHCIPRAFYIDRTVFSRNPRSRHLQVAMESLSNQIQEPMKFGLTCGSLIEKEIAKWSSRRSSIGSPSTSYGNSEAVTTPRSNGNSTVGPRTPADFNMGDNYVPRLSKNQSKIDMMKNYEVYYGGTASLPKVDFNSSYDKKEFAKLEFLKD